MWRQLYDTLAQLKGQGEEQSNPSKQVISKCEARLDFIFPTAYISFVSLFGPGEIGGYFNIFAPGYPNKRSGGIEGLISLMKSDAIQTSFIETYRNRLLVKRMLPFCDTIGGDVIAWDPADCTDSETHDYLIYAFPNDSNQPIPLAKTFPEFVDRICLGSGYQKVAGRTFKPLKQFIRFGFVKLSAS